MKVMLAPTDPVTDFGQLKFPLLASPKIDGVRAVVVDGVVMSRSMKPIPNPTVQALFGKLEGMDGELAVGPLTHPNLMQNTMSGVMSKSGTPLVTFNVFDYPAFMGPDSFDMRFRELKKLLRSIKPRAVKLVEHVRVDSPEGLGFYEQAMLEMGYEGIMVRHPEGPYKHGRCTLREALLLKVKRFADREATIIGFEEEMHNANEAKRNAAGKLERSSHKANKVGKGRLGAFVCQDSKWPKPFTVAGFTDDFKAWAWANRPALEGKTITYKYLPHGCVDAPRHPTFKALRAEEDM